MEGTFLLQLAEEHQVKFMETSAKSSINVEQVCMIELTAKTYLVYNDMFYFLLKLLKT